MGASAGRSGAPSEPDGPLASVDGSRTSHDIGSDGFTAEVLSADAVASEAIAAAVHPPHGDPSAPAREDSTARGAASSAAELIRLSSYLVFNVVSFLLIIRYLPKAEMGWYALVNVIVNLGYVIAELQMEKVAVRRITQGHPVGTVIDAAVGVRLAGSVIATVATQFLFVAIGLAHDGVDGQVQLAALLASSQFFGESAFVVGAAFQSQLRAYLDVLPRMVYVVVRFVITLVLLAMGVPWWALFLAWVIAYAIADVLALILYRVKAGLVVHPRVRGNARLVREALTLGVAGLLGMATVQWGTLYLGFTGQPDSVAVFNTAILPVQYLSMFGGIIAIVAFPLVSAAWARRDRAAFGRIDGAARTSILALFLPVTVLLFKLPLYDLMEKVFGEGYGEAAQPLRLMSIALILVSMVVWAGFVFLSVGQLRAIIAINASCLVVGIIASPLVVPTYGIDGLGAVGILATGLGLAIAGILLARGTPARLDIRGTLLVLLCGLLLWLALDVVEQVTDSILVLTAAAALLYPLLLLGLRVLPSDVIQDLRTGTSASPETRPGAVPSEPLDGGVR